MQFQYKNSILLLHYNILDTMDISNQGPTDLTIRELIPMEVQLCSQGETNEDSFSEKKADLSQDIQRSPISSQAVPMNDLGLSSQCSSSCATPSKDTPISTPKSRKRKGYRATKDRKRDAIKKRDRMIQSFVIMKTKLDLRVSKKIERIPKHERNIIMIGRRE